MLWSYRQALRALIDRLGDIADALATVDPDRKAEAYRALGMILTFDPQSRTVRIKIDLDADRWDSVSVRGRILTRTTWSSRGFHWVRPDRSAGASRWPDSELLVMMLENIDRLTVQITLLEKRVEELAAPFFRQVERLAEIPGIGRIGAAELIGEVGVDMTRCPAAAHLVSWAKFAPAVHESADTKKLKRCPRATRGRPSLSATPLAPWPARTACWATATGGSPAAAARARPWSPSATAF